MSKILKKYASAILELCIFSSVFVIALVVSIALLPVAFLIALAMAVKEVVNWMKKGDTGNIPVNKVGSSAAITPLFDQKIYPVERFRTYSRRVIYIS